MAYEWRGKIVEGAQGDQGATGAQGDPGLMGSATKQPALRIGSVPIKTGTIYFYRDMYSTDIVATGTISVFSNEGLVTSAETAKLVTISILLPACEAPTEENHGDGTIFYGYVDRAIDLSGMTATTKYRLSNSGNGACAFSVGDQTEKSGYGDYKITALKLSQNQDQFSTFLY